MGPTPSKILIMEQDNDQGNIPTDPQMENDPDELNVGFYPSDPNIVIPQIQKTSLTNRRIGFDTLIMLTGNGVTPELQQLLDQGVFQLAIESLNPSNKTIIGLVATAVRKLGADCPELFDQLVTSLPIDFLLSIPNSTEVIDLISVCISNSDEFAELLLQHSDLLLEAIGNWIVGSEEMTKSTLDLLISFVLIPGIQFDFSLVYPFLDENHSPDIRALVVNLLLHIEQDHAHLLEILMGLVLQEIPSQTVLEVLHDVLLNYTAETEPYLTNIYSKMIEIIELPYSAVILADIASKFSADELNSVVSSILHQELCIERIDAIFRIMNSNNYLLPNEYVSHLFTKFIEYGTATVEEFNGEIVCCLETILSHYSEYFADQEVQSHLTQVLINENGQYGLSGFKICLYSCMENTVIPDLLQAFLLFNQTYQNDLVEMAEDISKFISNHQ